MWVEADLELVRATPLNARGSPWVRGRHKLPQSRTLSLQAGFGVGIPDDWLIVGS
jgi:hypothetical protein